MPERIQLRRTKGWRKPAGAIVVSRPSGWGNPFKVGETFWMRGDRDGKVIAATPRTVEQAVELFRWYVTHSQPRLDLIRKELGGRDLCCWCPLDAPCHADVLLELANRGAENGATE